MLGLPFDVPPPYIPVDEEYPVRPASTYSLVKSLEEEVARHFCRWDPELKMIGLRFSNVMDPEDCARFPGSADLAAEVYSGVPVTRELGEHETMLSIDKARRGGATGLLDHRYVRNAFYLQQRRGRADRESGRGCPTLR